MLEREILTKTVIQAESYNVNAWPALAKERLDNIILVGAVDNDGLEASFSQGGHLVDVWAPGVKLMVRLVAANYGFSLAGSLSRVPHLLKPRIVRNLFR